MSNTMARLFRRVALAGALALVGTAVYAQDVGYNFMPGTDFTKFKTYRWVKVEGVSISRRHHRRPDQAGDRHADGGQGPHQDRRRDRRRLHRLPGGARPGEAAERLHPGGYGGWGWGGGYRGYGYGGGHDDGDDLDDHGGTLSLDMYDPAAKKLVWRGTASKTIDAKAKPEKRQKNLNKAHGEDVQELPAEGKDVALTVPVWCRKGRTLSRTGPGLRVSGG